MPKVSITLGSSRPGGLDITIPALAAQTFQDFEVIFIDYRYKKRHAQVLDYVEKCGLKQPFYHVPHHRNSDTVWNTICAGYNTGFMLATGDIVIMLLDYAHMFPDWIERHVEAHDHGSPRLVVAPHQYRRIFGHDVVAKDGGGPTLWSGSELLHQDSVIVGLDPNMLFRQRDRFDEISIFREPFDVSSLGQFPVEAESDTKAQMSTGPIDGSIYMHTKNDSFPRETVLSINGMDEHFDHGIAYGDNEFGGRLVGSGLHGWLSKEAQVECLNPRYILPNINHSVKDRKPEGRWGLKETESYWRSCSGARANNPYDLVEKRDKIFHWRDLSQQRDPVIIPDVIPDKEYFT